MSADGPRREQARRRWLIGAGVAAVAALLVLLAVRLLAPAPGRLIHRADFETGDFSQWSGVQAASSQRYGVVSSPVAQGRYAGRFTALPGECRGGDCPQRKSRTEAIIGSEIDRTQEGDDRWYAWSTLFPARGSEPTFTFTQLRSLDERAEPYAVAGLYGIFDVGHCDGGIACISFSRNGTRWSEPLRRGRWIRFLLHIHYSNTRAKGLYELWVDGRRAVAFHDVSKPPRTGVYLKQGVYRLNGSPAGTVYQDGLRIATSRSVASGG